MKKGRTRRKRRGRKKMKTIEGDRQGEEEEKRTHVPWHRPLTEAEL